MGLKNISTLMKNYGTIARSFIALLFVVAGYMKVTAFASTAGYIGSLGVPMPTLATLIVILIEIPVALAFAYGYKVRETGYALIAFVVLTTLLAHRDFAAGDNMLMALKNLAIIGGIMLAIRCGNKNHN
jgi:putative oxidoreductase